MKDEEKRRDRGDSAGAKKRGSRKRRSQKGRSKKGRRRAKAIRILCVIAAVIVFLAAAALGIYGILKWQGKSRLKDRQKALENSLQAMNEKSEPVAHAEALPAGTLRYQGKTYVYKENILTFLFMGIDRDGEVEASDDLYRGGQADALFLAALDLEEKTVSIIGVNRDAMAEISVYDRNGLYAGTQTAQIALAHAYGDGLEKSCENTVDAVSRLFFDLPIHGYCALNMEVVKLVNDAVGGVDVVIPESAADADMGIGEYRHKTGWKTGEQVHLMGDDAYTFIRYRDETQARSAQDRLARQKQYLNAFIAQAKTAVKKDLTLPVKLYSEILPYMVTDISAQEAVHLATEALSCSFGENSIYSLAGEVKMGETFEEFYCDETALYELILQVFYEEQ